MTKFLTTFVLVLLLLLVSRGFSAGSDPYIGMSRQEVMDRFSTHLVESWKPDGHLFRMPLFGHDAHVTLILHDDQVAVIGADFFPYGRKRSDVLAAFRSVRRRMEQLNGVREGSYVIDGLAVADNPHWTARAKPPDLRSGVYYSVETQEETWFLSLEGPTLEEMLSEGSVSLEVSRPTPQLRGDP